MDSNAATENSFVGTKTPRYSDKDTRYLHSQEFGLDAGKRHHKSNIFPSSCLIPTQDSPQSRIQVYFRWLSLLTLPLCSSSPSLRTRSQLCHCDTGKEQNVPGHVASKNTTALFVITINEPVTQNPQPQRASGARTQAFNKGRSHSSEAAQLGHEFTSQTWGLFFTAAGVWR